jgi:DNA-binding response OmpR family regulator
MARILVIDDDEQIRRLLRIALNRRGFDVVEANDGLSALRLLASTPVDLVITDVVMPRMEGLETIRHLRAAGQTRIIAMSGGGGGIGYLDYLEFAEKLGASATFAKPFAPTEIVHAVEQLLAA